MDRNAALSELAVMFPGMERDILDAVYSANNNSLEAAIDNLLAMSDPTAAPPPAQTQTQAPRQTTTSPSQAPALPQTQQQQPQATSQRAVHWSDAPVQQDFRRQFESMRVTGEPVPPYENAPFLREAGYMRDSPSMDEGPPPLERAPAASAPPSSARPSQGPIIGRLPDDFLVLPTSVSGGESRSGRSGRSSSQLEQDEMFARMLQNEEFVRHLNSNQEFRQALDAERRQQRAAQAAARPAASAAASSASTENVQGQNGEGKRPSATEEDVPFKVRLQSMGEATKRKFSELAQKFSSKSSGAAVGSPLRYSSLPGGDDADANLLGESDDDLLDEPALADGRHGARPDMQSESGGSLSLTRQSSNNNRSPRKPSQLSLQ
eukprot:Opistho-1_new@106939